MWKCKCGTMNGDNSSYCQSCGTRKSAGEYSAEREKAAREIVERENIQRAEREKRDREEYQRAMREQEQKRRAEEARRKLQERENADAFLKANGHEGFYEYQVLSMVDSSGGTLDIDALAERLNTLGRDGWHLKCAFANEIGHNSTPGNAFAAGVNATIDQSILIFERFIKFDQAEV